MQAQDTTYCCSRCGLIQPLSEFHKRADRPRGHVSHCRTCDGIRTSAYVAANIDKVRAQGSAHYRANRERYAERWASWYARNQPLRAARETERAAQWRRDHHAEARILERARRAVSKAISRGELIRPETCEACGAAGKIQGAHFDYSRPLEVRWLCRSCHTRWDAAEPKLKMA